MQRIPQAFIPLCRTREPGFEYGLLPVGNEITVNGTTVESTHLFSIDDDSSTIEISGTFGSKVMLLGGEPFTEPMVMWWNFIGRSHEEVAHMRSDWERADARFAAFDDRIGGRIPAPDMPTMRLRAR